MQHVIVRHAIFFLEKYGSLAVWSCQGMENSHHAAKTTYSGHTQHSGGKLKKSPLLQTFQHWFRIVGHRFRNQETEASNPPDFDLALSVKLRFKQGERPPLIHPQLPIVPSGGKDASVKEVDGF